MSLRKLELADRVQGPQVDAVDAPSNVYKLGVFFDEWTPKVANRIFSQVMTLQTYFRRKKVVFEVAGPPELKDPITTLGVSYVSEFGNCSAYRVYINKGNQVPAELSEAVVGDVDTHYEYIEPEPLQAIQTTDTEAQEKYSGFPLQPQGKSIAPTMVPKYYDPTRKQSEPMLAPFI